MWLYQDIINNHDKDLDYWQNHRYCNNFLRENKFIIMLAVALIESHLVSVTVDPIKVHDDGKLKKAGHIEDCKV